MEAVSRNAVGEGKGEEGWEARWVSTSLSWAILNKQMKQNDSLAMKIKLEDKLAYLSLTIFLPWTHLSRKLWTPKVVISSSNSWMWAS